MAKLTAAPVTLPHYIVLLTPDSTRFPRAGSKSKKHRLADPWGSSEKIKGECMGSNADLQEPRGACTWRCPRKPWNALAESLSHSQ